jgi:hypothetical protein
METEAMEEVKRIIIAELPELMKVDPDTRGKDVYLCGRGKRGTDLSSLGGVGGVTQHNDSSYRHTWVPHQPPYTGSVLGGGDI